MCIPHWRMVPAPLQRNVTQAYRRWRVSRKFASSSPAYREAIGELRKAQRAAIAAVREKELRKLTANPAQETLLPSPQEI